MGEKTSFNDGKNPSLFQVRYDGMNECTDESSLFITVKRFKKDNTTINEYGTFTKKVLAEAVASCSTLITLN